MRLGAQPGAKRRRGRGPAPASARFPQWGGGEVSRALGRWPGESVAFRGGEGREAEEEDGGVGAAGRGKRAEGVPPAAAPASLPALHASAPARGAVAQLSWHDVARSFVDRGLRLREAGEVPARLGLCRRQPGNGKRKRDVRCRDFNFLQ